MITTYKSKERIILLANIVTWIIWLLFVISVSIYFVLSLFINVQKYLSVKYPLGSAMLQIITQISSLGDYVTVRTTILDKYAEILERISLEYLSLPEADNLLATNLILQKKLLYHSRQFDREYAGEPLEPMPHELSRVTMSESVHEERIVREHARNIEDGNTIPTHLQVEEEPAPIMIRRATRTMSMSDLHAHATSNGVGGTSIELDPV